MDCTPQNGMKNKVFFKNYFSPVCAGGFGQGPWLEAHGGSTYCAVAALTLMGKLGKSPLSAAVLRIRIRDLVSF
jgi:hypothetical protein